MTELSILHDKMTGNNFRADSDEEWARRIREGSYRAFEALFDTYFDELVSFAAYHVSRHDVAQDIVQDVFFKIWRSRVNWYPRGALRVYLYGATRNQSLMYLKHKRVERRWQATAQEEEPHEVPDGALRLQELDQLVQQAIDELPERRQLIFTLSRQQDLTYAEIAGLLGLSIKTVESQMVSALRFLRERLSDYLPRHP